MAQPIRMFGDPVLKTKAAAVAEIDGKVARLVDNMFDSLYESDNGLALAAPQIGVQKQIVVWDLDEEPMAIINPEITPVGPDVVEDWEGCLSIPDVRGRVPRAREIEVKAYDRRGHRISLHARGFTARVIQHETDHLDGVLFFDRMKTFESLTFLDEYSRYWAKDNS